MSPRSSARACAIARPRPLAVAVLTVGLAACQSVGEPVPQVPPLLRSLPRPLTTAEQSIVRGTNAFSVALLRQQVLARPTESVVLSPFSVSMALGMAANGAAGSTLDAMRGTLGLAGLDTAGLRAGYRTLSALVRGLDPGVTTEVANSVWYSPAGVAPLPSYLQSSKEDFGAEVRQADFRDPATVGAINGWVNSATRGMIPRLIESLGAQEVMALLNAVYLKAPWRYAFDASQTRPATFTSQAGAVRSVPTMEREMPAVLTTVAGATATELLYGNGAYGLVLLLPGGAVGAAAKDVRGVVDALGPAALDSLAAAFADTGVAPTTIRLPKLDLTVPSGLTPALKALGMEVAFRDDGSADFSRINGRRDLFLTRVEHRARVTWDEVGTTAAAATFVGVGVTSARPSFTVDRPFVFLLRERLTGTILFAGTVLDIP